MLTVTAYERCHGRRVRQGLRGQREIDLLFR